MRPHAILFDAVGTLIHPTPAVAEVYARVGAQFGSPRTPTEVAARLRPAYAEQDHHDVLADLTTSEDRERARWRSIIRTALDDLTDAEGCFAALYAHFASPSAWSLDPLAEPVLTAIAAQGIAIGLASNFDRRLHPIVAALPGLRPVQAVVVSSEVGYRKPAPKFFAAALGQVRTSAEQTWFVGDDLNNDYQGARLAGLYSILFDPAGRHAREPDVRRIEQLDQLLDWLA
jgi:putative hydrolase of the HAD superfamily